MRDKPQRNPLVNASSRIPGRDGNATCFCLNWPPNTLRPGPDGVGTNSPTETASLLAEAESLNNRLVALGIVFFEVVEQTATLADQHEKTAA